MSQEKRPSIINFPEITIAPDDPNATIHRWSNYSGFQFITQEEWDLINVNDTRLIKNCCDCVDTVVNEVMEEYKKNNTEFKVKGISTIFDMVLKSTEYKIPGEDKDVDLIIAQILNVMRLKYNETTESKKIFKSLTVTKFIQVEYMLTENQAMVLMHFLDYNKLISHGGTLYAAFPREENCNAFLKSYGNKIELIPKEMVDRILGKEYN